MLERAGLDAAGLDEHIDFVRLQTDDPAEAIGRELAFVDESIERARGDAEPRGRASAVLNHWMSSVESGADIAPHHTCPSRFCLPFDTFEAWPTGNQAGRRRQQQRQDGRVTRRISMANTKAGPEPGTAHHESTSAVPGGCPQPSTRVGRRALVGGLLVAVAMVGTFASLLHRGREACRSRPRTAAGRTSRRAVDPRGCARRTRVVATGRARLGPEPPLRPRRRGGPRAAPRGRCRPAQRRVALRSEQPPCSSANVSSHCPSSAIGR